MTRPCPGVIPASCQGIFSSMDCLATRFPSLAGKNGTLSLLDLTQLPPLLNQTESFEFLNSLLSPAEAGLFSGFRYPKRRQEWLGGRLVAKHCLSRRTTAGKMTSSFYCEYSILPDGDGCPRLDSPLQQAPAPTISISHSREYAAALVTANAACGIDIQLKTAQLMTVQERFTSEKELALLLQIPDQLTRLGMIWTAKEAVKKGLLFDQATFFGTISLTEITYEPKESIWTARCLVTNPIQSTAVVRIAAFGDYLIACTTGEEYA